MDPLTEKSIWSSPFIYVENSPFRNIDLFGMEATYHENGNMTFTGADAFNYFSGLQKQYQKQNGAWQDAFYQNVGMKMFESALDNGFTTAGALLVLAQAYNENATSANGRNRAYKNNNWFNMRPLNNKYRKEIKGKDGWAYYTTFDEGICAYIWRMTSPSNLIEWKNKGPEGTFNPSFPEFGAILRRNTLPTSLEINTALRIGTGNFEYCAGCNNYGNELLQLATGAVRTDIVSHLAKEINNLNNRISLLNKNPLSNSVEIIKAQTIVTVYQKYLNNISNVK